MTRYGKDKMRKLQFDTTRFCSKLSRHGATLFLPNRFCTWTYRFHHKIYPWSSLPKRWERESNTLKNVIFHKVKKGLQTINNSLALKQSQKTKTKCTASFPQIKNPESVLKSIMCAFFNRGVFFMKRTKWFTNIFNLKKWGTKREKRKLFPWNPCFL